MDVVGHYMGIVETLKKRVRQLEFDVKDARALAETWRDFALSVGSCHGCWEPEEGVDHVGSLYKNQPDLVFPWER